MDQREVLIVGGGPAGSTLARILVRAGLEVVVADRASFPRDKVCAGWITPEVSTELELDGDDYVSEGRTLQPIRGFRVGRLGGESRTLSYEEPVSFGILRREFDDYLLRRSAAQLRLGTAVRSLEWTGSSWILDGELEAPLLVGAGGHFCPVARHLAARAGVEDDSSPLVVAQELELALSPLEAERCAVAPDVPELYFSSDLKGYGWCFRKGEHLNVGLGREDRQGLTAHVRRFVDWLTQTGRIPADLEGRFKGHAYLLYGRGSRPIVADGALLIGDAAGLAYPASGEGIRPAVESAILAAETILEAPDYRAARLEPYRDRLRSRFGEGRPGLAGLLPEGLRRSAARHLLATEWFMRRILVERWFLHRDQPPLVAPGPAHRLQEPCATASL